MAERGSGCSVSGIWCVLFSAIARVLFAWERKVSFPRWFDVGHSVCATSDEAERHTYTSYELLEFEG